MKYVAWFLILVVIIVGGLFGYAYHGARLQVRNTKVEAVKVAEKQELFDHLKGDLLLNAFTGTKFQDADMLNPEDYEFVTFTVRLRNAGFFDAEWIRLEVTPGGADILQVGDERGYTLANGMEGNLSGTVLMYADATTARDIKVTYYVLGHPYAMHVRVQ